MGNHWSSFELKKNVYIEIKKSYLGNHLKLEFFLTFSMFCGLSERNFKMYFHFQFERKFLKWKLNI